MKQAMQASCWSADLLNKQFTSPKTGYRIGFYGSVNRLVEMCNGWHSDMTGEELFNYLHSKGLKPYWIKGGK